MAIKPVQIEIRATDKATPAVKGVASAVDSIAPASRKAGAASAASLDGMHQRGLKAADGIKSISEQLAFLQRALITIQGGGMFAGMIQDVARTADEYSNLEDRIRLATGEGDAFERAMAAVTEISLRTNSSLEATGNLFARLTDAGTSAGLSAQDAQAQALALTESVNQAVQLSGASAQASDAALTQLIQGLQGGVLRGDEFNSVMEQSPRLARAMADGLGVTTGELRKMATEGKLTSEVVIQALQSQSTALKSEFSTLTPTVGRAVQNLATSWTVYVGEANKATGASKLAATAIDALSKNLDTVAGFLIDAGQAAAAFAALRLAQTFLGIGAAANASSAAIAANTVALTAANAASAGAAAGVGRFASILSGLKTFSLLGLLTNIQDIGEWIGESAAKLAGYKDLTEELAEADRARAQIAEENRQIALAQTLANKAAIDSQFELSAAAKTSLSTFDELVSKGDSAAQAVASIGKDFDLASLPGIANAAAVLDKLAADGKLSADQFRQAWADALKGEDLQAFEVKARAALAGSARETERLAAVMDGTLREAIRRSGGDFDVLAGGMSRAARSAINDTDTIINGLDRLKAQGVDVGGALALSLNKGIQTADSQAAIDALRTRVEALRKELGSKVTDGLLSKIEDQAKKAAGGLGGLEDALKKLGVTSDTSLKKAATDMRTLYEEVVKTGGSAREQSAAFEKFAQAAIASGDAGSIAFAKSQTAARGLEITTDAAGKTIVRSMAEAAAATAGVGESAQQAAQGYNAMARSAEDAAAAVERAAEAERKRRGVDKQGFSADADGNRIVMASELKTLTGISNFLKQAGLTEEQAKQLALEFSDGKGNIPYVNNPGQLKYGGKFGSMSTALLKAAEKITFEQPSYAELERRTEEERKAGQSDPEASASRGSPGASDYYGSARSVNVTINTPSGQRNVRTDEQGAKDLVDALRIASRAAGL